MLDNCFRTSYAGDRNNTQAVYTCHKEKTSRKHSTSIQPKHVILLNQVCKKMKEIAIHVLLQLEVIKQLLLQNIIVTLDKVKSEILPNSVLYWQ